MKSHLTTIACVLKDEETWVPQFRTLNHVRGGRVNKIALNRWFLVAIISVYLLEKPMGSRPLLSVGDVQNAVPEGKIEIRKGDSRNTISRIRIHADVVVLGPKSAAITNPSPFRG
ncbi:hypothetical protein B296_00045415 [Ensete ventricosum]|uniref:Uncharacterized protein n=1 Tax=Ensete ventricosum TaxID=4639 RepID=A0A426Z7M9_ENSVE|nr:hypothetical protein B296_00045415 [Ensete ventricosum]